MNYVRKHNTLQINKSFLIYYIFLQFWMHSFPDCPAGKIFSQFPINSRVSSYAIFNQQQIRDQAIGHET